MLSGAAASSKWSLAQVHTNGADVLCGSSVMHHMYGWMCRYEKVEEQKRQIRKKQELEKRFNKDDAKDHSSSDEEEDDEDKINETQEAGMTHLPPKLLCQSGGLWALNTQRYILCCMSFWLNPPL